MKMIENNSGIMTISVYAVIQHKGKVLLTQDHYKAGWKLPGGSVENNELIMDALRREVMEEVNLKIRIKQLLLLTNWIKKKTAQVRIRMYFVADLSGGNIDIKNSEVASACWFSIQELRKLKRKEFLLPQHYYTALKLYLTGKGINIKIKKSTEPKRYDLYSKKEVRNA